MERKMLSYSQMVIANIEKKMIIQPDVGINVIILPDDTTT
jgi:hypothetical protein